MFAAILHHTPLWVYAILAYVVKLGVRQSTDHLRAPRRAVLMPLAMAVLSLAGLQTSFAHEPIALAALGARPRRRACACAHGRRVARRALAARRTDAVRARQLDAAALDARRVRRQIRRQCDAGDASVACIRAALCRGDRPRLRRLQRRLRVARHGDGAGRARGLALHARVSTSAAAAAIVRTGWTAPLRRTGRAGVLLPWIGPCVRPCVRPRVRPRVGPRRAPAVSVVDQARRAPLAERMTWAGGIAGPPPRQSDRHRAPLRAARPPTLPMPSHTVAFRWVIRELRVAAGITLAMTVFTTVAYAEPFWHSLLYTACTALPIQALIEAGRYGFAALLRRRFPGSVRAQRPWPGWGLMVPWVIVSGIVGYAVGDGLADRLVGHRGAPTVIVHDARTLMLSALEILLPAIGITYFFEARGRLAEMTARGEAAMRAAAENRLKLLESQLEPHMLFNTLANLRVLIGTDPPRAQQMLDRLIDFLRATLDASRRGTCPLSAEFARIDDYLQLMQIRMGARLHYRLDLPPQLAALPVPPLLLQPLVENAIRHGLEPKLGGGRLDVSATREGAMLTLCVRDTGVGLGAPDVGERAAGGAFGASSGGPFAASPGAPERTSFGTQQVRARLSGLYGAAGSLDLANATDCDGGTLATVRLPAG
ncbi:hypothetical protein Dimus_034996 [Dionaea muscipula]